MEKNKNTTLKEFYNQNGHILRGILLEAQNKDCVVLMMGGFERSGTTEKKFKTLADRLVDSGISSFRFDAADCGLSDGNFYNATTKNLSQDLLSAHDFLISIGYKKIVFAVHSLAACALSLLINQIKIERAVLIGPALNQKELLRLWFARKNNPGIKIDWNDYKNYFQENEFINSLNFDLIMKSHRLSKEYGQENQNQDYGNYYLSIINSILLVHGTRDDKVPFESLNINFRNKILIENGDHDLEQPEIIEQWIGRAVDFLKN